MRLCLKRHARYWELGSLLLGVPTHATKFSVFSVLTKDMSHVEVVRINAKLGGSTSGNELSPEERQFLDRLPILAVL